MTKQSKVIIVSLLIIPLNVFYGVPATEWLRINYPNIFGLVAKIVIVFWPIAFFTLVYVNNKKILKNLNECKDLIKHNDKKTMNFSSKDLQIANSFSITAMVLWAAFMLFLAFKQGSNFLSFVNNT